MKSRPKVGTVGELQFVVGPEHVIDFATDGMPAVLSTPRLIGLLERTAREALYPFLDPDERSVGMEIEIRHLAPTPLGASVTCTARVVAAEGTTATFHVEARDEYEVIVRGLHKRGVIRVESFARRVARKAKTSS
jgi:fluoroacetyl-CoA thioesterase